MRVLLLGADTPLGMALEQYLEDSGRHEFEAIGAISGRWRSERHAKKVVRRARPEVVVDARLQSAVDGGEALSDLDVERCHWLAKACQRGGASYLLLSSSQVFAGEQERPYTEQDVPDSAEAAGHRLRRAEALAAQGCERHLLLRLGPVFSWRGRNPLTRMLEGMLEGTLTVSTHLRSCPVAAREAARVVAAVLDQLGSGADAWGVFHYASAETTTCYEFAETILASASQFAVLGDQAVTLLEAPAGQRSLTRRLDCNRLRDTFAIRQLPWRDFVADAVKLYFNQPLESLCERRELTEN
ncbi:MAG: sugar nucleotide-binding protein [Parahaliea sp.]